MASTTVPGNEHDNRLFSHQMPRPLTAHQMADALAQATDVANQFDGQQNRGKRAIEIQDPSTKSTILETFGRCNRVNGCASVANPTLSLRQALVGDRRAGGRGKGVERRVAIWRTSSSWGSPLTRSSRTSTSSRSAGPPPPRSWPTGRPS